MTLRAASSIIFLVIGLVSDGTTFSRALCNVGSQCPSDPISMVCRLETNPLLPDHLGLASWFLFPIRKFLAWERLSLELWGVVSSMSVTSSSTIAPCQDGLK